MDKNEVENTPIMVGGFYRKQRADRAWVAVMIAAEKNSEEDPGFTEGIIRDNQNTMHYLGTGSKELNSWTYLGGGYSWADIEANPWEGETPEAMVEPEIAEVDEPIVPLVLDSPGPSVQTGLDPLAGL